MAYVDIGDIASGATITEGYLDQIRANQQAGVPDIFTTEGDIAIATAADTAARLAIGTADDFLVAGAARPEWQIPPAVHLTKSGTTAMSTSSWTAIDFDTETSDTNASHEGVTNPSRITIPTNGGGWYTFGCFANATRAGATGTWMLRILLNGATVLAQLAASGASGVASFITLAGGYSLAATNYLQVQYYTADASMTIAASPMFWAIWHRRQ